MGLMLAYFAVVNQVELFPWSNPVSPRGAVRQAINVIKPGGIVVLGAFAEIGPMPFVEEKTVVGSLLGARQQMLEILQLPVAGRGQVDLRRISTETSGGCLASFEARRVPSACCSGALNSAGTYLALLCASPTHGTRLRVFLERMQDFTEKDIPPSASNRFFVRSMM